MSQRSSKPQTVPDETVSADHKSGRIAFDADGRGIWEWQIDTGVFTRTVTEDQLMKLAATQLQVLETPQSRKGQGIWPYGSDRIGAGGNPAAHRPINRSLMDVRKKPSTGNGPVRRLLKKFTGAE